MHNIVRVVACLCLLALQPAQAGDFRVGITGGTLGVGIQASYGFSSQLGARMILAGLDVNHTFAPDDLEYDADVQLRHAALLLDYHPFGGVFHVSGGLVLNDNYVEVAARCEQLTCSFGDNQLITRGSSVHGEATFNSVSPYVGIGWASAPQGAPGLGVSLDIGAYYLGEPEISLTVDCGPGTPPPACQQARQEAEAEEAELENEFDSFQVYPVVMFGIAYRF